MYFEGHPVLVYIKLRSYLIEDGLPDVTERSIEVAEDNQFVDHGFLRRGVALAIGRFLPNIRLFFFILRPSLAKRISTIPY
jgi:hypothetical protein